MKQISLSDFWLCSGCVKKYFLMLAWSGEYRTVLCSDPLVCNFTQRTLPKNLDISADISKSKWPGTVRVIYIL